jgi:hypothetical protein
MSAAEIEASDALAQANEQLAITDRLFRSAKLYVSTEADPLDALKRIREYLYREVAGDPSEAATKRPTYRLALAVACLDRVIAQLEKRG